MSSEIQSLTLYSDRERLYSLCSQLGHHAYHAGPFVQWHEEQGTFSEINPLHHYTYDVIRFVGYHPFSSRTAFWKREVCGFSSST